MYSNVFIMGDFNINFLNDNKQAQSVIDLLATYNLHKLFEEPSRYG